MGCNRINQHLDDYLDGLLAADERAAVEGHVKGCRDCSTLLATELRLRRALRQLPAPEPSEIFLDRAIARAAAQRQRWFTPGLALAASVTLLVSANLLLKPATTPVQDIPGLTITLNQVREVSLVFDSEYAMENARFTIQLPEGIELSGYPGQREIIWEGALAPGKNLLVLPVEARSGRGGELIANVAHTGKRRNFILRMDVQASRESPITGLDQITSVMVM